MNSSASKARNLPLRYKILISLAPTVLLLLAVEGLARLVQQPMDRARSGYVEPDKELGWKLKPQSEGPLKTNRLGFRDWEPHNSSNFRVLVLGDSVTWGDGVRDIENLYTSRLERDLNETFPARSIDVINAGVPGYSTWQERLYFEKKGVELAPQVVLLQVCLNDLTDPFTTLAEFGGDPVFLGIDTRQMADGIYGLLLQNSVAFEKSARFIQGLMRRREAYDVKRLLDEPLSVELTEAWEKFETEVIKLNDAVKAAGAKLVILITPFRFQLEMKLSEAKPQHRLNQIARQAGIPVVDILPVLKQAASLQDTPLFTDESHLTPAGHHATSLLLTQVLSRYLHKSS